MGNAARRNSHKVHKARKEIKWEVVVIMTCPSCGKEGGVTYSMEGQRKVHPRDMTLVCQSCSDHESKRERHHGSQKKSHVDTDREERLRKEEAMSKGFLLPRLLD